MVRTKPWSRPALDSIVTIRYHTQSICSTYDCLRGGGYLVSQVEDLQLAFHSLVMADALLVGNSALSTAASWLSRGWIWAFQHTTGGKMPPNSTLFRWEAEDGAVDVADIKAPRWPRPAPGPRPALR